MVINAYSIFVCMVLHILYTKNFYGSKNRCSPMFFVENFLIKEGEGGPIIFGLFSILFFYTVFVFVNYNSCENKGELYVVCMSKLRYADER